jgi:hypothetical protein
MSRTHETPRKRTKATAPFSFLPYLPTHPLMQVAWVDCLRWAITEEEIIRAFRTETGCTWTPGRTPLERMIDAATGAEVSFLEAFLSWFNR